MIGRFHSVCVILHSEICCCCCSTGRTYFQWQSNEHATNNDKKLTPMLLTLFVTLVFVRWNPKYNCLMTNNNNNKKKSTQKDYLFGLANRSEQKILNLQTHGIHLSTLNWNECCSRIIIFYGLKFLLLRLTSLRIIDLSVHKKIRQYYGCVTHRSSLTNKLLKSEDIANPRTNKCTQLHAQMHEHNENDYRWFRHEQA